MLKLTTFILLLLASVPSAATEHWLIPYGGLNRYGLSEITDALTSYRGYALDPGSMDSGISFGGGLELVVAPRWSAGIWYEHLSARTHGTSDHGTIDADLVSHLIKVAADWRFWRTDRFTTGLSVAMGACVIDGTIDTQWTSNYVFEGAASGAGFLLEVAVGGEYNVARRVHVFGAAGRRVAAVDEVMVGAAPLRRDDNDELVRFDYGGNFVRVGLKFGLSSSRGSPLSMV